MDLLALLLYYLLSHNAEDKSRIRMNSMQQNSSNFSESEISIIDVVNFLKYSGRVLLIASIFGALLGMIFWFFLARYSAEYILQNNAISNLKVNVSNRISSYNKSNAGNYAIDIVTWKTLQKRLPSLAAQIDRDGKVPLGQEMLYRSLANANWWRDHVITNYAISKSDTRDLLGTGGDLDEAGATILSLTVTDSALSKESAEEGVREAARFLRVGGAYLQLLDLLNSYQYEALSMSSDLEKKITTSEIELGYLRDKASALNKLSSRYPLGLNSNRQQEGGKDLGDKYISLEARITSTNAEIIYLSEKLQRMHDRLAQTTLIKAFLMEAMPIASGTLDGLLLSENLLSFANDFRARIKSEDMNTQEVFNTLRAQIIEVQSRFTVGLNSNLAPTISEKRGFIKFVIGGFALTLFLALAGLVVKRIWIASKENRNNKKVIS